MTFNFSFLKKNPIKISYKIIQIILFAIWVVFIIYTFSVGVIWLSAGLVVFLGGVIIFRRKSLKSSLLQLPVHLFFSLIFAIIIRIFILEICVVPSGSMEDTLLIGDRIIINKLAYGPRLPRSIVEIPWLHGLYFFVRGNETYLKEKNQLRENLLFAGKDFLPSR